MYKIIGADQKEYGPVTGDQIRHWISEGRVNGDTRARLESETEWRTVSAFPEFAEALAAKFGGAPPPPLDSSAPDDGREAALRRVKAPAIALMITAVLNFLWGVWDLVKTVTSPPNLRQFDSELQQLNNPQMQQFMRQWLQIMHGPLGIAGGCLGLAISVLIFIGAMKMQSLRSYEFSVTAAVLAMVPCLTSCCFIGLPFGIWALIALTRPGVKSCFH